MADTIINSIRSGSIFHGNISFEVLRRVAGINHGQSCYDSLDRGRAVLSLEDELDQYLYSYGPMTKSQWAQLLPNVSIFADKLRVVDYGCGQGLASAFLFDDPGFGLAARAAVTEAILIEPSIVALARAEAVFACYCPNATVTGINKYLDYVTLQELGGASDAHTLHFFSNVLDISDFNHVVLFDKILQLKGSHSVLVVSHDRNHTGGSSRILDLNSLVFSPQNHGINISKSDLTRFKSTSGYDAISWQLQFEA